MFREQLCVNCRVDSDAALEQTNALVTLYYDAIFIWESPVHTKLFCVADTRYYPYDKQTCRLTLSARPYTAEEISLYAVEDGLNVDLYQYVDIVYVNYLLPQRKGDNLINIIDKYDVVMHTPVLSF